MPHSPKRKFTRFGLLVAALGIASCDRQSTPEDNNIAEAPAPEPAVNDSTPIAEAALDRQGLLVTLLNAASAAVIGADDGEAQRALNGRRFDLRMRFGCPDVPPAAGRSWTYDAKSGALKVTVKPDFNEEVELAPAGTAEGAEPATAHRGGFMVPAPTILAVGCPSADYAAVPGFTNLRFGLAQTTADEAPRSRQLLDSYEITKKIAEDAAPDRGLDLVLRGRMENGPDGKVITCEPRGGVIQCLANVTLDKVAIENPATSVLIAEWGAN